MIQAVYRHIQDSQRAFVKEEDVQGWLNQALLDVDARLRFTRIEVTGTTTGNTITLPVTAVGPPATVGVVEPLSLRLGTDDVVFVSDDDWNDWSDSGDSPPSTLGRVFNGNIELYPTPGNATAYTFRYLAEPAPLVNHSDSPTLPKHMHPKLVAFAAAEACYQDGNLALGDRKHAEYLENLPSLPTGASKLIPGPLTVGWTPGPFDTDPQAVHI